VSTPTLSVLIPTYNYANYLPEAIESVVAQDYPVLEVLIVDDCSSDNTAEVVQPYCLKYPHVQFSRNTSNLGLVENWNLCLERARGEYVKYLFGDDKLCHPKALSKLAAMLQENPSATLAASARVVLNEKSEAIDIWQPLPQGLHDGRKVITAYLMENGRNLAGEPSAVLFRKKDAQRGFNPMYRQVVDIEMWLHLLAHGDLVYTREPLCAYRCHAKQLSEQNTASGLGAQEHQFFYGYALQEWIPRKAIYPLLFHLHRHLQRQRRRKPPAALDPQALDYERRLIERGGKAWRWFCRLYYIRYRFAKLFHFLSHGPRRRLFCSRWRQWPDSAQNQSRL
jgi:glycosyltransferase involved in cell wall biosynthesis